MAEAKVVYPVGLIKPPIRVHNRPLQPVECSAVSLPGQTTSDLYLPMGPLGGDPGEETFLTEVSGNS